MTLEEPVPSFWTHVLSLSLSVLGGVIATSLFVLFVKPRTEKLFEDNRNYNLDRIFSQLKLHNVYVGIIFETIENTFGSLKRERKYLVPIFISHEYPEIRDISQTTDDVKKFEQLKKDLENNINSIKKFYEEFRRDRDIYSRYLHDSFLQYVDDYHLQAIEYLKWLITPPKGVLISTYLINRKKSADKIIEYLKEDRKLKKEHSIKIFIDDWQETIKELELSGREME